MGVGGGCERTREEGEEEEGEGRKEEEENGEEEGRINYMSTRD